LYGIIKYKYTNSRDNRRHCGEEKQQTWNAGHDIEQMVDKGDGRAVLVVTLNNRVQCSKKNIVARLRALLQDILMEEQIMCHAQQNTFLYYHTTLREAPQKVYTYTHTTPQILRKWARDIYKEDRTQYFMGVWIIASYAASIADAQMMNPPGSKMEKTANTGRNSAP
jgi:hypothetical protein